MKQVYIDFGGQQKLLRYDINAVTDIEGVFGGKSLITMLSDPGLFGFSLIRALLWGGLKYGIKGLNLQRTGVLMQEYTEAGGTLEELFAKINDALVAAGIFKTKEDEAEETEVK